VPERPLQVILGLAAVVAAGLVAVAVAVSVSSAPGPATGAARLVPGDALLYVHVSTDQRRPAVREAIAIARRFPDFPLAELAVLSRLGAILTGASGRQVDFASQVRPWLGREAAFALLNTTTSTAGSLIVLDVGNRARAGAFVAGNGLLAVGRYHRIALMAYRSGTTLGFVGHYLVLGQPASVRAAIDAAQGRVASLASTPSYRQAAADEPGDRVIDAYLSADGVRRVLAPQGGLLGALGVLLYQPALTGTTLAVSPFAGGLRVRVHAALDATLARAAGPPPPEFTPTMAGVLPEGTTLLLDVTGLSRVAPRVLGAGAEGGVAGRVGPLLKRLGAALASEGVDVARLTSLFSGETAVAVAPASRTAAGVSARGPALVIVTRTRHQQATRRLLADLEVPLAQLFPPPRNGPGVAPEFSNVPVAGITAHQLVLEPGLQLDYAVFRGLVVISTSLQAIAGIARHSRALADEPAFAATLADHPSHLTSLVFLDFSQLLGLAELTGLGRSGRIATLRPDLAAIKAIGLTSTRGEADTTAELTLQIS
jgi:hypothetical protein